MKNPKIEQKIIGLDFDEIKSADESGRAIFTGIASAYGNKDLTGDIVAFGAFSKAVESGKPLILLSDHSATIKSNIGFGRELKETKRGLQFVGELNLEKEAGREAYAMLKHAKEVGHKTGLSIGYSVDDYEWNEKTRIRTIKEATLWETSLVAFPANPKATVTSIAVKSLLESGTTEEIAILKRDIETHLRDACGFSKSAAEAFVAVGWNALGDQEEQGAIEAINQITQNLKS